MNKILKISLIVLGVGGLSAGTWYLMKRSGGSDQLKFIPKEATVVASVNFGSIYGKIDMARIKKLNLWEKFEKMVDKSDELAILSEVMRNPKESGINLTSNIWFFSMQEKRNRAAGGMVVPLNDEGDFEKLLRKSNTKGGVEKEDKYKYVKYNDNMLVGWANSTAIFYFNDDEDKLVKGLDNIMVMEKADCILSNELFADFKNESHDAGAWLNYAELVNLAGLGKDEKDMLSNYGVDNAAGNFSLDFGKNDIKLVMSNSFKDKEKSEEINIFNSSGLSDAHMQNMTPDEVFGLFSASVNIKKVLESVSKNKEIRNSLSEMREELGLSKDEFENLFTGEFSLAVVGFDALLGENPSESPADTSGSAEGTSMIPNQAALFRTVQYDEPVQEDESMDYAPSEEESVYVPNENYTTPPDYMPLSRPMFPDLVFTISAKNPGNIERILKKNGSEKNDKGIYTINMGFIQGYAWLTRSAMVISTNLDVAEKMVKKGGKTPAFKGAELAKSSPLCLWADLDFSHYPKKLQEKMKSGMGNNDYTDFKEAIEMFKGFSVTGDSKKMEANVNMVDSDKYSIMRLLEMVDDNM